MSGDVELNVVVKSEVDEDSFNQSTEMLQTLQAGADAFVKNFTASCIRYRETLVALNNAFAKALDEPEPDPETCKIWLGGFEFTATDINMDWFYDSPTLMRGRAIQNATEHLRKALDEAFRDGTAVVIVAKGLKKAEAV